MKSTAKAAAHPNIAFIKYWGNQNHDLRIPSNGSLSMNLKGLETQTTVSFDTDLEQDQLIINTEPADEGALTRVSTLLDRIRELAEIKTRAQVVSENNFPTGTGIASSASAFAALTLASVTALGLCLSEKELSQLARTGSGSASRSIPGGFVEWQAGLRRPSHLQNIGIWWILSSWSVESIKRLALARAIRLQIPARFRKSEWRMLNGAWIFAAKPCWRRISQPLQRSWSWIPI